MARSYLPYVTGQTIALRRPDSSGQSELGDALVECNTAFATWGEFQGLDRHQELVILIATNSRLSTSHHKPTGC